MADSRAAASHADAVVSDVPLVTTKVKVFVQTPKTCDDGQIPALIATTPERDRITMYASPSSFKAWPIGE